MAETEQQTTRAPAAQGPQRLDGTATAGAIMKPWPTKPESWSRFSSPGVRPRMGLLSGVTS